MQGKRRPSVVFGGLMLAGSLAACAPPRGDVYRLPAAYNFAFYDSYEFAARSFYAAHFTHFGTYENLMAVGPEAEARMAGFADVARRYIVDPPRFEPPADVIAPTWSRLAFDTGQSMHWTHMLHSQLYDILTDDRVTEKRAVGERAISYYLSEGRKAFSTRGYGHRFMEGGGDWAGVFRDRFPEVNGILWAYHWHHAAVYEALMEPDTEARGAELARVLSVFEDSVLNDLPTEMPLTAEVAPEFSRMFPSAAHIFDNLHMMHDIVNDIMADDRYALAEKAAEIERLRSLMVYEGQDLVVAPGMPMHGGHEMNAASMRVPTRLTDGSWLPQGHPQAEMASMEALMRPLPAPGAGSTGGAR